MTSPILTLKKIVIPETQVIPCINKETHTPIPSKAEIESLQDFQKTILSEMNNMRSFLETVEQRVIQIEDTMIGSSKSQCNRQNQEPEFFVDLLRNRMSTLEKEFIEKNAITDFLLKERSKPVSYKKENQNMIIDANQKNEEGTKPRNSAEKKKENQQRQQQQQKINILVVGDSMPTGISGKSLSKKHNVSVTSFSGGTSEKNIQNVDDLLKDKPDDIVIHVGTNGITNGVTLLNSVKKIVKQVSDISPRTTDTFSSIIIRKDEKHVEKPLADTNTRLKNYCRQKGISFIENSNIKESHLRKKKLHLDKTGKSFFAKNLINYIKNLA